MEERGPVKNRYFNFPHKKDGKKQFRMFHSSTFNYFNDLLNKIGTHFGHFRFRIFVES